MTDNAVTGKSLQAQIDAMWDRMEKGLEEIKAMLRANEERLRALENRESSCQPLIQSRLDAAWKMIDELKAANELQRKTNEDLHKLITGLQSKVALIMWVFGLVGGGTITWLLAGLLGLIK